MKILSAIWPALLLLVAGCTGKPEVARTIDSSQALQALQQTEALDREYVVQTDDSLIRIAVAYYDSTGQTDLQARAYYQWAGIFRDRQEASAALEKYTLAERYARRAVDSALLGRIYNNIGNLYFRQSLDHKADSLYRLTEQVAAALHDTALHAEALYMQGKISLYEEEYPQAEAKLQAALDVLGNLPHPRMRASIAATQSDLYGETGQSGKAIRYARLNLALQPADSPERLYAYLLLGDAYFKAEQYDSADVYIRRSLHSRSHSVKAGAYMRLADMAELQGDINRSLEMERLYSAHKDSMAMEQQASALIEKEQELKLAGQRADYEAARHKSHTYYVIALVCCIAVLAWGLSRYYTHRFRRLSVSHNEASLKARKILEGLPAYAKIRKIVDEHHHKDEADTLLTDDDWQQLVDAMDKCRNRLLSRIALEYQLTPVETRLCLLQMLQLNMSHSAFALRCARPTVYKIEKSVLAKMNRDEEKQKLRKVLAELG